jgi:uroporphyrinogen III methyltransferase/synthase
MAALDGQVVVVTRAAHQSAGFVRLLEELGATVKHFPVFAISPPDDWGPVDRAIAELDQYAWLIFTSANAVDCFFDRAGAVSIQARVAAVGPATGQALAARGVTVDLIPPDHIAEGLVTAFAGLDLKGVRMLLPRAASARDILPNALRAQGAIVDIVDVYRNTLPVATVEFPLSPDWLTFTSASTVKNLLALVPRSRFAGAKVASIGPETSAALRRHQLPVTVEASPSTQEALAAAMSLWENGAL